jgi:hypothetical protein
MQETDKVEKENLIAFRPGNLEDASFIFSTWLKGLRFGNDWYSLIDSKVYFSVYHKVIEGILSKPNVSVKVACLKEDPGVILGYAVYSGTRLDWCHVKKSWRNIGLARDLVPQNITTVSHLTSVGRSILKKREGVSFNPFNYD